MENIAIAKKLARFGGIASMLAVGVLLGGGGGVTALATGDGSHDRKTHSEPRAGDVLFVGDQNSNTVAALNVRAGTFLGEFVAETDGSNYEIAGPRGIIFFEDSLFVANQNANLPLNGEILKFDAKTGCFQGKFVADTDPNAPFAPRGIVAAPGGGLYVADDGNLDGITFGNVKHYDREGNFVGNLDTTGFTDPFYPRALVFGHDGLLYVSARQPDAAPGYVVRFKYDHETCDYKFHDVFAQSTNPAGENYEPSLHRPEGLVFGPNGNLYVTSFAFPTASPRVDDDQIIVFDCAGKKINSIDLDPDADHRDSGQALLFGPKGDLFISILGPTSPGVRRYSSDSCFKDYTPVPTDPTDSVQQPWYLTFRHTNPFTLVFDEERERR